MKNENMILSFGVRFNENDGRVKPVHGGSKSKKEYYHLVFLLTQTSIGADAATGDEKMKKCYYRLVCALTQTTVGSNQSTGVQKVKNSTIIWCFP